MRRRPPRSTRTDTLFPYTTLFRSAMGLVREPYSPWKSHWNWPIPEPLRRVGCVRSILLGYTRAANSAQRTRASGGAIGCRSEEHTSELQSLMRISYAVFCLKKKKVRKLKTQHYSKSTQKLNT